MKLKRDIGKHHELGKLYKFVVLNHYTGHFTAELDAKCTLKQLAKIGRLQIRESNYGIGWSDIYIEVIDVDNDTLYHVSEFADEFDPDRITITQGLYDAIADKAPATES